MRTHGFYTTTVQDVEIIASADNEEFTTIRIPAQQARHLGHLTGPDGKDLFGRLGVHRVIREGRPAEQVRVFTCARGAIII